MRNKEQSDAITSGHVGPKLHGIQKHINVFPATVPATVALRIEKLVYGYIEQCDEFKKQVEAEVLAFVLNVHNGTVCLADKLRHIGLRPSLCLSGLFQSQPEPMEVKPSFILVHSHITLYHCTFRVDL